MSMFSEYLLQLIQVRAISISKLSRDSGVERTAIHKALADERILPYRAVDMLSYCLKLSPKETRTFHRYYDQLFESENARLARECVDKIFSRLSDLTTLLSEDLQCFQEFSLENSFQEKHTYKGYGDISRLLRFLIGEELKWRTPKLELAVPSNVLAIKECIESLYRGNANVEISHIMYFDASNGLDEYNLHNLEYFGGVLPGCIFSDWQYHVYYYYNDMVQARYTDPLPFFLVTHAGAVCFSENCQTAIYLKEKEQIEYFHTCFYHLRQSCHKLMEYVEEPVAELKKADVTPHFCAIMSQPYIMEMWEESSIILFTRKGISKFLETGSLYDSIAGAARIVPQNERAELLDKFLEAIRSSRVKGRLVNDMKFTFPDDFSILASENLCLFVYDKSRAVKIRESSLCRALYDWSVHFSEGDCIFDKGKTEEILAEML